MGQYVTPKGRENKSKPNMHSSRTVMNSVRYDICIAIYEDVNEENYVTNE